MIDYQAFCGHTDTAANKIAEEVGEEAAEEDDGTSVYFLITEWLTAEAKQKYKIEKYERRHRQLQRHWTSKSKTKKLKKKSPAFSTSGNTPNYLKEKYKLVWWRQRFVDDVIILKSPPQSPLDPLASLLAVLWWRWLSISVDDWKLICLDLIRFHFVWLTANRTDNKSVNAFSVTFFCYNLKLLIHWI